MSTTIPQEDAGMAMAATEDFKTIPLFTGDTPVTTTPEIVADAVVASVDLPAYSVVGRDGNGKLVKATWNATPASGVPAVGVTTATVKAGATAKNVAMYRSGMFNPNALVWDASYDTDEKKRLAFEYAQDTIFIRKPAYPLA